LSHYQIGADNFPAIVKNLEDRGMVALGEKQDIGLDGAEKILALSV
jgi:alcohol dehydrogenase YqhD (iron-dependent ADH family)